MYFCCSGLCQQVSSHCLLLWEPTDKASAQGKLSLLSWGELLNSEFYFLLVLMSLFFFILLTFLYFFPQFPQSMGSRLRCNAASLPTEGALGLLYWPVIQGHWERSCFISVLQFYWTKWFLPLLDRFASGLLYQSMFYVFWIHVLNCAVISV